MTADGIDLEALEREAGVDIASAADVPALTAVRARYLGKKGSVAALLRSIGSLEASERGRVGQEANAAKQRIEAAVAARREAIEGAERRQALSGQGLDVTLPGAVGAPGHLHPITQVTRDMVGSSLRWASPSKRARKSRPSITISKP